MQRTFLITGATKGIGLALSHRLTAIGRRVVGVARYGSDGFPGTVHAIDLSAPDGITALDIIVRAEGVDGIVNNVGLVKPAALGQVSLEDLDAVMRVNLHSALVATPPAGSGGGGRKCAAYTLR